MQHLFGVLIGMSSSQINSRYVVHDGNRFYQGDILQEVSIVEWADEIEEDGEIILDIKTRILPYVVILTQDCDLEQDFNNRNNANAKNNDKYLQSVLVCPAFTATSVKEGDHMKKHDLRMQVLNSGLFKPIKDNRNYRYHYLAAKLEHQLPELIIDFKQYFTIPRDIIYTDKLKECYQISLSELFRENLSQRFCYYLSRIGLPEFTENQS